MNININTSSSDRQESQNKLRDLDSKEIYDAIIIGGGPAGLTAAVYCIRKELKTALITVNIGGQVIETAQIENYTGFRYIEGFELVQKFNDHVKKYELNFKEGLKVIKIINQPGLKKVVLEDNTIYQAKTLIIASGMSHKKLNLPGEDRFTGRGVSYCTSCDAPLFKNKNVIVVGGGNSGVEAAIELSNIANKVTLVEIADKLKADKILIDKLNPINNLDIFFQTEIIEIKGDKSVQSVVIKNKKTGSEEEINCDGIFVQLGLNPNTDFVKNVLLLNEKNEIVVDCNCQTNVEGIFAAGDVTLVLEKQIIVAAGEGAKAALTAYKYLLNH